MKGSLRQSMAWLHTWAGLLVGWVLFAVFVTGTSAYFQQEITRWMQPELQGPVDPVRAAEGAVHYLEKKAPDARSWFITLPDERSAVTSVFWLPAAGQSRGNTVATLDGNGRAVHVRDTSGGFFLYRFHFDLHYMPVIWARWIVGFCAMFMLVAILSGVITHKKIFKDFFTLRLKKGQRSWLDAHNASAVLALPFHLMITYTGLVTLFLVYMPWGITANFKSVQTYSAQLYPQAMAQTKLAGHPAELFALAPLLEKARHAWHGRSPGYINIKHPGDAAATIQISSSPAATIGARGASMVFSGVDGALLGQTPPRGGAARTESVMVGLHAGRFAGTWLRWLYFLCSLAGCVMVGSGLVLWTVKRRQKLPDPARPHFGFRLVEKLNIGSIAGLPVGMACYFLANRLLPLDMAQRADWEVHVMFICWGLVFVWALLRPSRRAWVETLALAAACFAAVPVVNALTTPRNLWVSLASHDWVFAGFGLTMLGLAGLFVLASRYAAIRKARPVRSPAAPVEGGTRA